MSIWRRPRDGRPTRRDGSRPGPEPAVGPSGRAGTSRPPDLGPDPRNYPGRLGPLAWAAHHGPSEYHPSAAEVEAAIDAWNAAEPARAIPYEGFHATVAEMLVAAHKARR